MLRRWLCGSVLLSCSLPAAQKFDLAVYGGTAGGVITAVSAAREHLKVALVEPHDHLGGMTSGGLSRTDFARKEVIGGYAFEFYLRAGRHYELERYAQDAAWFFEPKIAEKVLREMAQEAGVTVFYRHRLREKTGVKKTGARVIEIVMENGSSFEAKIFADCSYEGDLMAQAGVSYTWGRESMSQYGESLAGVREKTPKHQFTVDISPYDAAGKLLPEVSTGPAGETGAADRKVQAYNFRMCLSDDRENQVPFPRPKNYDTRRYELFSRMLKALTEKNGRAPAMREVALPAPIPNHKVDVNNNGAFSTDYIGKSWDYPEANYQRRQEIWQEHIDYTAGFFYFLAHDARVPADLQKEINNWGLAKDEFADTNHWPHQLYIREARRMTGMYVMSQKDIQTELTKPDAIGMGSYNSDSHNIQRLPTKEGFAVNEGDMQVGVKPYQIPYRIMVPKKSEAENLLVPVCVSASHVAYSTLRMEPQYMILGHAAGVAAFLAIEKSLAVQDIDAKRLTLRLQKQGAIMEYAPNPHTTAIGLFRRIMAGKAGEF